MPVIPNQIPAKIQAAQQKGSLDVSEIVSEALSIYCIYYNQVSSGGTELLRNVWNVWICATAAGTGK